MSALPTNYVDAVLDATANTRRKYNLIENGDGTVSLEEVTTYTRVGSNFGASDINHTNEVVNQNSDDIEQLGDDLSNTNTNLEDLQNNLETTYNGQTVPFVFGIDANGNYGYRKLGADAVTPFKNAKKVGTYSGNTSIDVSTYGATSAAEFLLVPSPTSVMTGSGFRRWATGGNWTLYLDYHPGGLSLSGTTLGISLPWVHAHPDSGNTEEGLMNVSFAIPCHVYYIGRQ